MGKISVHQSPPNQSAATHFSHPHPLKLCNYQPQSQSNPSSCCSGCRLQLSGPVYCCTVCNYFLHKKCFEMPNKITHPCHKDHTFSLLPHPAYADGIYKCDACGDKGDGFSYHCKPCGIDLHITCAVMPLSVAHPSHVHKLNLTFDVPYFNKEFCCDVCKSRGSDHWLYRCVSCGFDAHLKCATTAQISPHYYVQPETSFSVPAPQPAQGFGQQFTASTPSFMQQNFVTNAQPPVMSSAAAVGVPAGNPVMQAQFDINRQQNERILQAMQQIIQNHNATTQAILSGSVGIGYAGVGGSNGLQQLMQLYSGISANGGSLGYGGAPGLSGYGGGSVGQDYFLQTQMNGGAGGQEYYLQALMNCAGGGVPGLDTYGGSAGGMESLQSLLGGGSLDFLSGAFGGFGL